jgi:predicted permease
MSWSGGFRIPGNPEPEREVDVELEFHLQMRTKELTEAGLDPAKARRQAEAEFGDIDNTRRYCRAEGRRLRRSRRFKHVLRSARDEVSLVFRRMGRRPSASLAPVAILTVAVALNALVLSVVRGVLLSPLPFSDSERVAVVEEVKEGGGVLGAAYPILSEWRKQARLVETVGGYLVTSFPLMTESGPMKADGAAVTAGFFDLLTDYLARGRSFTEAEHEPGGTPVVVISEGFWKRAFGENPEILGTYLEVDGRACEVIGVVRDIASFPDGSEVWLPVEQASPGLLEVAGAKIFITLARIRPGVGLDQVGQELGRISSGMVGGAPSATAVPVADRLLGDVRTPLRLLQGAVFLVLLAAAVNAGGLLLARGMRRRTELALQSSLGAGSTRMGSSLLLEGLFVGAAAGIIGVILARGLLGPTLALVPVDLPRAAQISLDPWVVSLALGLASVTGVATAAVSAFAGSRTSPATLLRESTPAAGSSPWLARTMEGMVVVQVALAVLLTAGAGLLLRSFVSTVREDPGFDTSNVVLVSVSLPDYRYTDQGSRVAFARDLLERAQTIQGAETVALGRNLPISGSTMMSPLRIEGSESNSAAVQVAAVTEDYFDLLRIPFQDGSGFQGEDREEGERLLVVGPGVVTAEGSALGVGDRAHSFFNEQDYRTVRGVVGAVRHRGLRVSPVPIVYEPFFQKGAALGFTLLIRSEAPVGIVGEQAREIIRALDGALPVEEVSTMSSRISASLAEPRFYTIALSMFGALALLLALAGCQASLAHRVEARRREIGIRMALGATLPSVRSMVLVRGLALTAMGIVVGILAAIPGTRVLETQLYEVSLGDPLTYGAVLLLLLAAGALASDGPARRAARQDPAEVLKEG